MSPAGRAAKAVWRKLTWDDLAQWVGPRTVERAGAYVGRVKDLAVTADGDLLAWVDGQRRYATLVEASGRRLHSQCTCPIGSACKHSVAVVLAYLELCKQGKNAATADADDPRWDALQTSRFKYRDFEEEENENQSARLRELLQATPNDELVEFTMGLLNELPHVADQLLRALEGAREESL